MHAKTPAITTRHRPSERPYKCLLLFDISTFVSPSSQSIVISNYPGTVTSVIALNYRVCRKLSLLMSGLNNVSALEVMVSRRNCFGCSCLFRFNGKNWWKWADLPCSDLLQSMRASRNGNVRSTNPILMEGQPDEAGPTLRWLLHAETNKIHMLKKTNYK